MKATPSTFLFASGLLAARSLVTAQTATTTSVPATYTVDPTLSSHTIYRPVDLNAFNKLPVIVWGNGACSANGTLFANFLLEVASWGHIVLASGTPDGEGSTDAEQMTAGIDWAVANAGKGTYARMDASRIAAAGQSCGGLEAYDQGQDGRICALGIFNSGQFTSAATNRIVPTITVPIFYFLGGPTDIAYRNGLRDYAAVRSGVPSWLGNLPVGHLGTYSQPKGGAFGVAAQHYFRLVLRGDLTAAAFFTGGAAMAAGWTAESKNLGSISVTPI